MPIKFAPKEGFAEIPEDVFDKIKELRANRARQIAHRINEIKLERARVSPGRQGDYRQRQYDAELEGLNNGLIMLRQAGGGSVTEGAKRGGMADIRMRMRRLPFDQFYLKERETRVSGTQTWLIGLTKRILSSISSRHRGRNGQWTDQTKRYDLGTYYIAVLCEAIGSHTPTFHLMPQSNPSTMARHMHHHVQDSMGKTNPLDWTPANCYGTFGSAITGTFLNADIPELFRMLYLFTKTLNPDSPLLDLSQLPHIREVAP
jgi:hypothetical protein